MIQVERLSSNLKNQRDNNSMKTKTVLAAALVMLSLLLVNQRASAQTETPRYEVGVQFSSLSINEPNSSLYRTEPGFGGRFTVNLTDSFAVEAETDFYPNQSVFNSAGTAGRAFSGLFGAKIGKRYNRFGIYGKARPGFISFSEGRISSVTSFTPPTSVAFTQPSRITHGAVDLGGVLEFYPSRHLVTRFDLGDTIIRYRPQTFNTLIGNFGGTPTIQPIMIPGSTKNNFQFNAGIGYRF